MRHPLLGLLLVASVVAAASSKQLGLSAFESRNYAEAVPHLQAALRSEPDNPQIRLALGVSLLMLNNEPLAFPILEPLANERRPEGLKAALALASHLSGKGRTADALPYLASAWRLHPGQAEVFLPYSSALERLRMSNELLRLMTDPSAPQDLPVATHRLELLVRLGQAAAARTVAESQTDPVARKELLGLWLRRTGKPAEAAELYRSLYETTRHPRYAAEYGRTLLETSDRQTVGRAILELVKPTAAALRVLRDLGLYETLVAYHLDLERSTGADQTAELIPLYESLSRWDDLLDRLVRHLLTSDDLDTVRPRLMDLVFLRDRRLRTLERLEAEATTAAPQAAGRLFAMLVEIRIRSGERAAALDTALRRLARTGTGIVHAQAFDERGWTDEAAALLDAVARRASQPAERLDAALSLADLRTSLGKPSAALETLNSIPEPAATRPPDADRIRHSRGRALLASGDFASAASTFASVQNKTAETFLAWALALHMTGDAAKALDLVRQAGRDRQRSADAAYLEGVILLSRNERTKAEEAFRRAASDPWPTPASLNALVELQVLSSAFRSTNRLGVYGRAVSLFAAGRYAEASDLFASFPGPLMRYRAAVCLGLARTEEAAALLETVRKDTGLPPVLRSHAAEILADLRLAAGKSDEARRLYTDILLENPQYPRQGVIMDRINRLTP